VRDWNSLTIQNLVQLRNPNKLFRSLIFSMSWYRLSQSNISYYHGTSDVFGLGIGDYILPPEGTSNIQEIGRKKNLDKVFFTISSSSARIYSGRAVRVFGGNPIVYEVDPIGDIFFLNSDKGTEVAYSDSAKILSII